jgi:hypothetical protein
MTPQATYEALKIARNINREIGEIIGPPEAGATSCKDSVLPKSIVTRTRSYIEKIVVQINISYSNGCYDACAVLIRRLIETLIIETFEHNKISDKIKDKDGEFFHLKKLIELTLSEPSWNLGRNTSKGLGKMKDIGDFSAHNRRFLAHKNDIDNISKDLRLATQEFLILAGLY